MSNGDAWKGRGLIGRGYHQQTHKAECAQIKVCHQFLSKFNIDYTIALAGFYDGVSGDTNHSEAIPVG
jgi:hypothetical protein